MNVFVLCTGRCGSLTFAGACAHAANYSIGHESKRGTYGPQRLDYPDNHIEVDNRLSWLLGRLDEQYGNDAFYVHLMRERMATAESFARRFSDSNSIIRAYADIVLMNAPHAMEVCEGYYDTVNANIRLFLKDKRNTISVSLEHPKPDFREFWRLIGAQGDLDAALAEWGIRYNASG